MKKSCLIGVRGWLSNVGLAVCLFPAVRALAGLHYVDLNCTNATPPYTNWTTAATNIQDAVDAAVAGDELRGAPEASSSHAVQTRSYRGTHPIEHVSFFTAVI